MTKIGKKWLVLLVAAVLSVGTAALLTACNSSNGDGNGGTQTTDWSSYTQEQWIAEIDNFDGKEISYQFEGTETQLGGQVLLNLYDDGSACARHQATTSYNNYVGYWSEAEDEDGNAISLTIVAGYGMGMGGLTYSEKNASYPDLYQLTDGSYTFSLDVDLSMGQYTRQARMTCDNTITYATFAAFEEAYPITNWDDEEGDEDGAEDGTEDGTIPEYALYFVYVADASDQLQDTMICQSAVWGAALGITGSYTPTDSDELLFTFDGGFTTIECYADGTYKFTYASVDLVETGTWTWSNWAFTLTTSGGNVITGSVYGG